MPEVEEDEDMPQAAKAHAPAQANNGTPAQTGLRAAAPSLAQPADVASAAGPAAEHAPEPEQAMAQPPPKEEASSLHRLAPEAPDSGSFGLQVSTFQFCHICDTILILHDTCWAGRLAGASTCCWPLGECPKAVCSVAED